MKLILIWLIAYIIPALIAGSFVKFLPPTQRTPQRNKIIMHGSLVISSLASQYAIQLAGLVFPWNISPLPICAYIVSVLLSICLIGAFAIWYALSALLQQITLLSITFLLLSTYPAYLVVIFVVPAFVLCHELKTKHWRTKVPLVALWGISSVLLFTVLPSLWAIAALHTLVGAALISRSIL